MGYSIIPINSSVCIANRYKLSFQSSHDSIISPNTIQSNSIIPPNTQSVFKFSGLSLICIWWLRIEIQRNLHPTFYSYVSFNLLELLLSPPFHTIIYRRNQVICLQNFPHSGFGWLHSCLFVFSNMFSYPIPL